MIFSEMINNPRGFLCSERRDDDRVLPVHVLAVVHQERLRLLPRRPPQRLPVRLARPHVRLLLLHHRHRRRLQGREAEWPNHATRSSKWCITAF